MKVGTPHRTAHTFVAVKPQLPVAAGTMLTAIGFGRTIGGDGKSAPLVLREVSRLRCPLPETRESLPASS